MSALRPRWVVSCYLAKALFRCDRLIRIGHKIPHNRPNHILAEYNAVSSPKRANVIEQTHGRTDEQAVLAAALDSQESELAAI